MNEFDRGHLVGYYEGRRDGSARSSGLANATLTLVHMVYALLTSLDKEDPALLGAVSYHNREARVILRRLGYPA